jgi:hypothetical protein
MFSSSSKETQKEIVGHQKNEHKRAQKENKSNFEANKQEQSTQGVRK